MSIKKIAGLIFIMLLILLCIIFLILKNFNTDLDIEISKSKKITLKVALWDYGYQEYDKVLISEFQNEYPNIEIEVLSSPNIYYKTKLYSWMANNSGIDVAYISDVQQYFDLARKDMLTPLEGIVPNSILVDTNAESLKFNSHLYGIPYRLDWLVLYYNKNIFDRYGLKYPEDGITWEEYRVLAREITKLSFGEIYGAEYASIFSSHLIPDGFDFILGDLKLIKRNLDLFLTMQNIDNSVVNYKKMLDINLDQRHFELGKSAMFINGTWFSNYLLSDRKSNLFDFNWGIVNIPVWAGLKTNPTAIVSPVVISKSSKHKKEAIEFLKYITGNKGAQILAEHSVIPGNRRDFITDIYLREPLFPQDSKDVIQNSSLTYRFTQSNDLRIFEIQSLFMEELTKALTGITDSDDAINIISEKRRNILNRP